MANIHDKAVATNAQNVARKLSQAQKFWASVDDISDPGSFSRFARTAIPRGEDASAFIRAIKYQSPEKITPLVIMTLKAIPALSMTNFRELIGTMRRIPADHERAFVSAMVNHKSFKKHEGAFELYDHASWIRDSALRKIVIKAGIDATPTALRDGISKLKVKTIEQPTPSNDPAISAPNGAKASRASLKANPLPAKKSAAKAKSPIQGGANGAGNVSKDRIAMKAPTRPAAKVELSNR